MISLGQQTSIAVSVMNNVVLYRIHFKDGNSCTGNINAWLDDPKDGDKRGGLQERSATCIPHIGKDISCRSLGNYTLLSAKIASSHTGSTTDVPDPASTSSTSTDTIGTKKHYYRQFKFETIQKY